MDLLELQFLIEDRKTKPKTKVSESKYYGRNGDPANFVKFASETQPGGRKHKSADEKARDALKQAMAKPKRKGKKKCQDRR